MASRGKRLEAIRGLVANKKISTQEELTRELRKLGFDVAQPTVSRDMADLGLVKVKWSGDAFYSLPEVERLRSMLKAFWQKLDWSDNLIVLKTSPGTAQGVAAAIDALGWPGIVGTVGGDDTTLIIARSAKERDLIVKGLTALKEEGPE